MTYKEYLIEAASDLAFAWRRIPHWWGVGLRAAKIALRALSALTILAVSPLLLPLAPLLAYLYRLDDEATDRQIARLRADIHRNGRAKP